MDEWKLDWCVDGWMKIRCVDINGWKLGGWMDGWMEIRWVDGWMDGN